MGVKNIQVDPHLVEIIPIGTKLDKSPKIEIQLSEKEAFCILKALENSSLLLRKYLDQKIDVNKTLNRYCKAYIKFQDKINKDFSNIVSNTLYK